MIKENSKLNLDLALLRLPQILQLVPVCKSTIWEWVRQGKFPSPIRLSNRCTVWYKNQIDAFIANPSQWKKDGV